MALFAGITEAKTATFNGHKIEHILYNGIEVFKSIFNVFKNGVLNENCTMSGEFEIADEQLFIEIRVAEDEQHSTAQGFIEMDVTDFSRLIVSGEYYSYRGLENDGDCAIMYRVDESFNTLFTNTPESNDFTLEIDTSEKTGACTFSMICSTTGGANIESNHDQCYTGCYINEIRLE